MEPQHTILSYVVEKLKEGKSKSEIKEYLSAVGWREDEIETVFTKALLQSGVPAPETNSRGLYAKRTSTVEVILGLFAFILLGIVATSFGVLYFNIINYFFPDALTDYSQWRVEQARNAIHYAMAGLIVGFPLYVTAMRMWLRTFKETEGKIESTLTKWITYLVLLVASVVVVGDLIAVLYTFLQGEISVRFFLKALVIFAIAGSVFGMYFLERKRVQYQKEVPNTVFVRIGWGVFGAVLLGIILGFISGGTPSMERTRTFDSQRSEDLTTLSRCIEQYAQTFQTLPETFDALSVSSELSYCATQTDPETGASYDYSIVTPLTLSGNGMYMGSFRLCATFTHSTEGVRDTRKWYIHPEGETCKVENISVRSLSPVAPTNTPTPLIVE